MKRLVVLLLLPLFLFGYIAMCRKKDIRDAQTYIQKNLQPNLRGYGKDLAE